MGFQSFTKTVLKNLFSKPATAMYPAVKKEFSAIARGHIDIDIDKCIYCGMCSRKCPTGAILTDRNAKSWEIDRLKCIQCNSCAENCPKKCLQMNNQYTSPSTGSTKDKYHARISDNE